MENNIIEVRHLSKAFGSHVVLRDIGREKEMVDKIRCRNGNLEIVLSKQAAVVAEL